MTINEPNVNPNGRYSMIQTCVALKICRDSLREYTKQGLIRCGYNIANNRPYYQGSEILRFWKELI